MWREGDMDSSFELTLQVLYDEQNEVVDCSSLLKHGFLIHWLIIYTDEILVTTISLLVMSVRMRVCLCVCVWVGGGEDVA